MWRGWFHNLARPRWALLGFIAFVPFMFGTRMWDHWYMSHFGYTVLDLALGLDGAQVKEYLEAYGTEGRQRYYWFALFDLFLPLVGAVMTCAWFANLFAVLSPQHVHWAALGILPALADWLENAGFVLQVYLFPDIVPWLGSATWLVSHLKLGLLIFNNSLLLIGLVLLLVRFFRSRLKS